MKSPKKDVIPRSIIVTPDMMQPTLAEAFARWRAAGEWPADAVLVKFGGQFMWSDPVTGERVEPAEWETYTHVQIGAKGLPPSQRRYVIFKRI